MDAARYLVSQPTGITATVNNSDVRLGAIEITNATTVTLRGGVEGTPMRIRNILAPTEDSDVATKAYVDAAIRSLTAAVAPP